MSQPQGNARQKTIFNDFYGVHPTTLQPVEGAKFPGQMLWEIANNGKILFKADDKRYNPNDQQAYKKKECEMGYGDRNAIFELLLEAASDPTFTKAQYTVKKRSFVRQNGQSKMSDQPIAQGQFTIIRDQQGVISLGYSRGDYKILFTFDRPGFSELNFFENGEWVSGAGRMSQIWVRSYVNRVRKFLDQKEDENYQPPKPKNGNGGGNNNWGGNGNNNNGNNGGNGGGNGGWGDSGGDEYDDIPF
ncbi:phage protein [Vibrio phage pTD1]|uniref:Phage protein n=1 Tax=Vibrio phage pTD1 TaxID=1938577 RepID=A0A1Q2U2Y3_9CAUD|nr:phage protein [Vibrio phage pTD1]BAW98330.1 phage protein [Vibrio phage pTD1]